MVIWGFTSSEEVVVDDITNQIFGDIADDPKSEEVVVAWDGDEYLGVALELGFELEMEKDFVKVDFLMK